MSDERPHMPNERKHSLASKIKMDGAAFPAKTGGQQKQRTSPKWKMQSAKHQAPTHLGTPEKKMQKKRKKQKKVRPVTVMVAFLAVLLVIVGSLAMVYYITRSRGGTPPSTEQHSSSLSTPKKASAAQPDPLWLPVSVSIEKVRSQVKSARKAKEAPESVKVEPAKVEVMMIGDVLMHDEIVDSGLMDDGSYNFDFVYNNIKDYIDAADLRILNQETVMGDPSIGYHLTMGEAGPKMNTPTALADTEARFGFNTILKATNHTLDLGYDGLGHELNYWKSTYPNMPVVGVNNPYAEPGDTSQDYVNNVYVYEKDGMKIGILNYTWATNENFDYDTDRTYVSYLSEDKIRADIKKARDAGAEMLIACPHWGIEYDTQPSEEELTYSQLFCDLGVDLIFGCHPHILQSVVQLQNKEGHKTVCFYSMGNFVAASLMDASSLIGGVARATLERSADGTYSVSAASLVPTVICHTYGPNMSAFPIYSWTNELCAQGTRPQLTPDYAYSFCANVLGEGFDTSTGVFTLGL